MPLRRAGSSKEEDRDDGVGGAVSSGLESRRDSDVGHGPEDLPLPPEEATVPGRVRGISISEVTYRGKEVIQIAVNMFVCASLYYTSCV
jgi:hypothetical protein